MASLARQALTILLFFATNCAILADWNTQDYLKKENSLVKPYSEAKWDFTGSTIITNKYVRLTSDHQSKQGAIWNTQVVDIKHWELHVHFAVHGQGNDLFGDGMAIWYARDRLEPGPVFGNKDHFVGLAIFLDTYSNHNGPHNHGHPYISAMVNNGSLSYDHDRDGTHTELAGCESHFRNKDHDTFLAIRYEMQTLTVSMDIDNKNGWTQCFSVSGVKLPTGYYLGASAATGELADNHDIISLKLYDIGTGQEDEEVDYRNIVPSADFFAPPRDHVEDPQGGFLSKNISGWKLLVIIIVGIIGLGVCAMVGFIIYTKRQEDQRKRFY